MKRWLDARRRWIANCSSCVGAAATQSLFRRPAMSPPTFMTKLRVLLLLLFMSLLLCLLAYRFSSSTRVYQAWLWPGPTAAVPWTAPASSNIGPVTWTGPHCGSSGGHARCVALTRPGHVQFVHQSWKTTRLPSRFERWSATWRQCFPRARHLLWTDADNREFVVRHYPWFLARYDRLPGPIFRADAVRYLYLFHFGGVYTDLDNECLRPFDHLLVNASIVLGAMAGGKNVPEGYVQNSFMYSVARHPLWLELVHQIIDSPNGLPPEELTGPHALVKVINNYRKRLNDSAEIKIYPPVFFNPFSWQTNKNKNCKHFNHMSDAEMVACRDSFRNSSFVVQYHTHTWGGGKVI